MEWIRAYTEEGSDCFPPAVISDTCAEIETVVRALRLRWGLPLGFMGLGGAGGGYGRCVVGFAV